MVFSLTLLLTTIKILYERTLIMCIFSHTEKAIFAARNTRSADFGHTIRGALSVLPTQQEQGLGHQS